MDVSLELKNKPLCTLSPFSYIPPRRNEPKEMSYFNRESKVPDVSTYDLVFHQVEGYDMTLDRDDRKHKNGKGLDINKERKRKNETGKDQPYLYSTGTVEKSRVVPVLSSSEYGRRSAPALYHPGRHFARVACIKTEFFMKNGITWSVEEGYGSVAPI